MSSKRDGIASTYGSVKLFWVALLWYNPLCSFVWVVADVPAVFWFHQTVAKSLLQCFLVFLESAALREASNMFFASCTSVRTSSYTLPCRQRPLYLCHQPFSQFGQPVVTSSKFMKAFLIKAGIEMLGSHRMMTIMMSSWWWWWWWWSWWCPQALKILPFSLGQSKDPKLRNVLRRRVQLMVRLKLMVCTCLHHATPIF